MSPELRQISRKKFVGKKSFMSFDRNTTSDLWRSFMPVRNEVQNVVGKELYSIEIYPVDFFNDFDPGRIFEKWAAIEVNDFNNIPDSMHTLITPRGLYAVFIHKGPASEGPKTYNYIFREWLPSVNYQLDDRPHFAVMGENYKRDDPESEEELWIPVRH